MNLRKQKNYYKYFFLILFFITLVSCNIQKKIDDTEYLWIGDNGIEFYE